SGHHDGSIPALFPSALGLLVEDLEAVAVAAGDDAEAGDADLGRLQAAVANLQLGQLVLDGLGIELEDDAGADIDAGLLQQGDVGDLPPLALPEEVEAVVPLARSEPSRRRGAGEVRAVEHLAAGDRGQLDVEGVEL